MLGSVRIIKPPKHDLQCGSNSVDEEVTYVCVCEGETIEGNVNRRNVCESERKDFKESI